MMTKTILLAAICVAICSAARLQRREAACGTPTKMDKPTQAAITDSHNADRAKEPADAEFMLKWREDLAAKAQEWADRCEWAHGMTQDCDKKSMGQNLYASIGGTFFPVPSMNDVVEGWYKEKADYNMDLKTCAAGKMCGHYTQVVWADTEFVGCGIKNCSTVTLHDGSTWNNAVIVVCDYSQAGNMQGEAIYEKGPKCSKCEQASVHGYTCDDSTYGLCRPCVPREDPDCICNQKNCQNGATWDADECSCLCTPEFTGKECEVSCQDVYPGVCPQWDAAGYCDNEAYDAFMTGNCAKTCKKNGC